MAQDNNPGASADSAVDPIEFIRRALQISPEDAAAVREDAAERDRRDNDPDRNDKS